jgi:8-oxo-dGTP pyrophosphatase MutT (NUDIX family)
MKTIQDNSFGIIPLHKTKDNIVLFCLVQHQGEHWGFPKGHPDPNETEIETAMRELQEETGISDFEIISDKFFEQKYVFEKDNVIYDKTVRYFIVT